VTGRRRAGKQTITVDTTGPRRFSDTVHGPVRHVAPRLRLLGIPSQYDSKTHTYLVPKARTDDLCALLESDGFEVDLKAALW
jgi:hypothetical protein